MEAMTSSLFLESRRCVLELGSIIFLLVERNQHGSTNYSFTSPSFTAVFCSGYPHLVGTFLKHSDLIGTLAKELANSSSILIDRTEIQSFPFLETIKKYIISAKSTKKNDTIRDGRKHMGPLA